MFHMTPVAMKSAANYRDLPSSDDYQFVSITIKTPARSVRGTAVVVIVDRSVGSLVAGLVSLRAAGVGVGSLTQGGRVILSTQDAGGNT